MKLYLASSTWRNATLCKDQVWAGLSLQILQTKLILRSCAAPRSFIPSELVARALRSDKDLPPGQTSVVPLDACARILWRR